MWLEMYIELQISAVVNDPGAGVDFASFDVFAGDIIVIAEIDEDHQFDRVEEELILSG